MQTAFAALMPAIVTLIIGYLAGRHQDFKASDAGVFNRLVMVYALPMALFAGTLATPKATLLKDIPLILWIVIPNVAGFLLVFFVMSRLFSRTISEAALIALLVTTPGIPFIGASVFPYLFGEEVTPILMAGGALALNLCLTPLSIVIFTIDKEQKEQKASGAAAHKIDIGKIIWSSVKEPIVWSPVLAYTLSLLGVHPDSIFTRSLSLLGSVTSGLSMFSTGLILYSYTLKINLPVMIMTLCKNIFFPMIVWAIARACGVQGQELKEIVVSLAIPAAAIATVFSVQYGVMQQQSSSMMFLSYILAPFTMAIFITLA